MDTLPPHADDSKYSSKYCPRCEQTLDISYFTKNKAQRDGLAPHCRECRKAMNKIDYEQNKDSISARHHDYYERNTDAIKARNRIWHEANRKRHNQLTLSYYFQNKETWDNRNRQWHKEHPEARAASHSKRRALKRQNGGSFTAQQWQDMKIFYDYTCLRCLRREPEIELTADHVLPLVSGGTSYIENIQPLCRSCNSWKRDRHIDYREDVSW